MKMMIRFQALAYLKQALVLANENKLKILLHLYFLCVAVHQYIASELLAVQSRYICLNKHICNSAPYK